MEHVNNNDFLLSVGDLLLGLALIPSIVFLIFYITTARWYRDPIGRMYVLGQGGIVLVSLVVLLSLWFGQDYPGRDWVRIFGYGVHLLGQIGFVMTYFNERRRPDDESALPKTKIDKAGIGA